MGTRPTVTVVIPCLDMGFTLDQAIQSVRAQHFQDFEIVVVDDGSSDPDTIDRIASWEATGVQVIRQKNRGVGAALNAGLNVAAGKYFMPLNDDIIDPPYLMEAVRAMDADDELGIVYCRATLFGALEGRWELPDFNFADELLWNSIFATSLFRTADWRAVRGFDEVMRGREDHDFILRILSLGRTVLRLEGEYFHYRRGRPSVNARLHAAGSRDTLIAAYARMFRNNQALYEKHAEDFMRSIFKVVDERNELRMRYRHLEAFRSSKAGSYLRTLKHRMRHQ